MATKKNEEVVEQVPATVAGGEIAQYDSDPFADAGAGSENVSANDKIIPRLALLQDNSKVTKKQRPEFIPGAQAGMFMDTAVNRLFDGEEKGVLLIPCFYHKLFVEWPPRGEGESGPPVRSDHTESILNECKRDEQTGRLMLPNGNNIVITPEHWCILVRDDGTFTPIVVSMTGRKARVSRQWNTLISAQVRENPRNGQMVTMPSFFAAYRMKTFATSNSKGDFFVPTIAFESETLKLKNGNGLYKFAREFWADASSGKVKAAEDTEAEGADSSVEDEVKSKKDTKLPF